MNVEQASREYRDKASFSCPECSKLREKNKQLEKVIEELEQEKHQLNLLLDNCIGGYQEG